MIKKKDMLPRLLVCRLTAGAGVIEKTNEAHACVCVSHEMIDEQFAAMDSGTASRVQAMRDGVATTLYPYG